MNEILQAIPGNQVIIPLVNEFFLEARRSCESPQRVQSIVPMSPHHLPTFVPRFKLPLSICYLCHPADALYIRIA